MSTDPRLIRRALRGGAADLAVGLVSLLLLATCWSHNWHVAAAALLTPSALGLGVGAS